MRKKEWDLVCMGRLGVDLRASEEGEELDDVSSFGYGVGGEAATLAIEAARIGLSAAVLSRVGGHDALGRYVSKVLLSEGVDTRLLKEDSSYATSFGMYGSAQGVESCFVPRSSQYADMRVAPGDFCLADFERSSILSLSGNQLGTIEQALITYRAAQLAKEAACTIVLSLDFYRSAWGIGGAVACKPFAQRVEPLFSDADWIVGSEEEFRFAAGEDSVNKAIAVMKKKSHANLVFRSEDGSASILRRSGQQRLQLVEGVSSQHMRSVFLAHLIRDVLPCEPSGYTGMQQANSSIE